MSRSKFTWMIFAVVVVVLGITLAGLRSPPDAATQTPADAMQVVASSRFKKLPPEQQMAYVQKAFTAAKSTDTNTPSPKDLLSPRQRRTLRENMREYKGGEWNRQIATYHTLSPDQQIAYLDRMIDQEIRDKEQKATGRAGSGNVDKVASKRNENPKDSVKTDGEGTGEWLKEGIESSSPEDRAHTLEFKRALRERRLQRGLADW